jgi:nicotinamidase-related amidase
VYREDVVLEAWQRVKANKGSAGIDELTLDHVVKDYGEERLLQETIDLLKSGTYRPKPVRRHEIPKPDGKMRPLMWRLDMNNKVALMVIDVQVGLFPEHDPVHNAAVLIENIKFLIEKKARTNGTPIIYVQHNARPGKPLEPGSPGWEIHPEIPPNAGDVIIQKTTPDSFHETNLQNELSKKGIKQIILTGIQTELCIDTTCRRARSLGYDVFLAKDPHSTFKTIATYITRYNHYNFNTWFNNLFGNIILFIPFGFSTLYFSRKLRYFKGFVLFILAVTVTLEVTQMLLHAGICCTYSPRCP